MTKKQEHPPSHEKLLDVLALDKGLKLVFRDKTVEINENQISNYLSGNPQEISSILSNLNEPDGKKIISKMRKFIETKEAKDDDEPKKLGSAKLIFNQLTLIAKAKFVKTPYNEHFCVIDGHAIDVDSEDFAHLLTNIGERQFGMMPRMENISSIRLLAKARGASNIVSFGVRTAKIGDAIVFDPLSPDHTVFVVTKGNVKVKAYEKDEIPLTVSFPRMLAAPVDLSGTREDFESILNLWNLPPQERILITGITASFFIPDIPKAVMEINGPHGSGKTQFMRFIRAVADPNSVVDDSLERKIEDLQISASHQAVLTYDNVSGLASDKSDLLCKFSSGDGKRGRKLYTNYEELLVQVVRPVILNGIAHNGRNTDLLDRVIAIHLKEITPEKRLSERELTEKVNSSLPKIRGWLLKTLAYALELIPEVEQELFGKLPRLADVVLIGEAFCRSTGYPKNSFLKSYDETRREETRTRLEQNSIVQIIKDILVEDGGSFEGTTSELFQRLSEFLDEKGFDFRYRKNLPNNEVHLGRMLSYLQTDFADVGIGYSEQNTGEKRLKRLELLDVRESNVDIETFVKAQLKDVMLVDIVDDEVSEEVVARIVLEIVKRYHIKTIEALNLIENCRQKIIAERNESSVTDGYLTDAKILSDNSENTKNSTSRRSTDR